jgi:hypothetical protein
VPGEGAASWKLSWIHVLAASSPNMELHKQPLQRCQNAVSCTRDAIFPSRFVSMIRWRGSRQHEIYGSKYDVDMIGNERSSQTQFVRFKFPMHLILSLVTVTDNTQACLFPPFKRAVGFYMENWFFMDGPTKSIHRTNAPDLTLK